MSKVADVKLTWTPSPSPGIVGRKVYVENGGESAILESGVEDGSIEIVVHPNTTVSFRTAVIDENDREFPSMTITRSFGNMEDLMPDTNLGISVVRVRDEEEPAPPSSAIPKKGFKAKKKTAHDDDE